MSNLSIYLTHFHRYLTDFHEPSMVLSFRLSGHGAYNRLVINALLLANQQIDSSLSATPSQEARQGPFVNDTRTVLVVDDQEPVSVVAATMLERAGFETFIAEDGPTALKIALDRPGRFGLLLTDFQMPHMSGSELGRAFQQLYPETPVVIMSGNIHLVDADPAWGLIAKPFKPSELLAVVNDVLTKPAREVRPKLAGREVDTKTGLRKEAGKSC